MNKESISLSSLLSSTTSSKTIKSLDTSRQKSLLDYDIHNEKGLVPKRESVEDSWNSIRGENVVNSAFIKVTNRQQQAKDSLGWRQNSDGTKTYSTYRGGQLVTLTGGEAFNAFMGDNKVAKGKKKSNKGAAESKSDNRKRKSSGDDDNVGAKAPAPATKTAKGNSASKSSSVPQRSRSQSHTIMLAPAPAPVRISPKAFVPGLPSQSGESQVESNSDEDIDWGF